MSIQVRTAVGDDANAASTVARRAKAAWNYPPAWLDEWRDALTLTSEYLTTHKSFVAVQGNEVVGVCVLEIHDSSASLEHVWIAPECQRRGVGRRLVATALDVAARLGLSRVEVDADPNAEGFYARLGARRLGAIPAPMPGARDRMLPRMQFVVIPDNGCKDRMR